MNEKCSEGVEVVDLLKIWHEYHFALTNSPDAITRESVDSSVHKDLMVLERHAEMLNEYFSIDVNATRHLVSLPMLLKRAPDDFVLPLLLHQLASVDYSSEQKCFHEVSKAIAECYVPCMPLVQEQDACDQVDEELDTALSHWIESALNQMKHFGLLSPPTSNSDSPTTLLDRNIGSSCPLMQLAKLEELYKVFERC